MSTFLYDCYINVYKCLIFLYEILISLCLIKGLYRQYQQREWLLVKIEEKTNAVNKQIPFEDNSP